MEWGRKLPHFFMNRRKHNTARVYRKVSEDPRPLINTVEGPMYILIPKHCKSCKTVQPLDNFYFKSFGKRKKYEDTDPRSRENECIVCWDERNK